MRDDLGNEGARLLLWVRRLGRRWRGSARLGDESETLETLAGELLDEDETRDEDLSRDEDCETAGET